jgi:hypothetical protein
VKQTFFAWNPHSGRAVVVSQETLAGIDIDAGEILAEAIADTEKFLNNVGAERILALAERLAEAELMSGREFGAAVAAIVGDPVTLLSSETGLSYAGADLVRLSSRPSATSGDELQDVA